MKCTDKKMRRLVSLYPFDVLREEEKLRVEAHILECDQCFEELYRFRPVIERLEEAPEKFMVALQPAETSLARINRFLRQQIESVKRMVTLIFSALSGWWQRPAIKILVPVTVTILLAIVFLLPSSKQYSELAILEKAPYQSLTFKGPVELTPPQKLFNEGMTFYEQDNYERAIQKLNAFLKQEPNDAYGQFYLGVSLLLTDGIESGIRHLNVAAELCQEQDNKLLLETCYWYSGNAYLKNNDVENALKMFRQVIEFKGRFEIDARRQITKIEKFQ